MLSKLRTSVLQKTSMKEWKCNHNLGRIIAMNASAMDSLLDYIKNSEKLLTMVDNAIKTTENTWTDTS